MEAPGGSESGLNVTRPRKAHKILLWNWFFKDIIVASTGHRPTASSTDNPDPGHWSLILESLPPWLWKLDLASMGTITLTKMVSAQPQVIWIHSF